MAHGLNSNMVHRWLREQPPSPAAGVPALASATTTPVPSFTAVPLTGTGIHHDIRLELRRGNTTVIVSWPLSAADACTKWLAQWLR